MKRKLSELTTTLNYSFDDEELIRNALTHRSVSGNNNERLEFLGDSVLNFVIAAELYQRYPEASEGDLSRLRASLVNKDSLAKLASDIGLGDWLYLGSGELKSGGLRRKSILADALEAVFGAVLLDGGYDASQTLILNVYQGLLDDAQDPESLKDAKTRLQEFLQSRRQELPQYELEQVVGKPHAQTFTVRCVISGYELVAIGKGSSRRKAEQCAAADAMQKLLKQ